MLRAEGLSYQKIYRQEIRCNSIPAKQKRQLGAALFAKEMARGVTLINFDESCLDQTCYLRRGWGPTGEQLYQRNVYRLSRFNIIAATFSTGEVYIQINNGTNNSLTVWAFILRVCLMLQERDPDWRHHFRLYADNASYHKSAWLMERMRDYQVPILFTGR